MPHRIACFPNCYGRFGVPAALPLIAEAGIRFVELPIKTDGVPSFFGETPVLTDRSTDADVARVRRMIADHGLELSSCNITSGNPLDRTMVDATLRKLDLSAQLGVRLVVAGAGQADTTEQRETLLGHLREIGDHAAKLGIIYCFETHPGLCQNADGMLDTMAALNHDSLRLNFDTGNVLYYNRDADVIDSLRRVIPFVAHVHLKDSSGKFEDWCFPALGAGGAVDFRRVREVLDEARFSGPCTLEIEGVQGEEPPSLETYQQRVVDSMQHLRVCGYID
ncbi:MAG: sugar phosphate isomerase/epimerase [Planctomycetota bacterium]|nr:MAG: sugar phosphate isomerase/epimerase [Planctomycetota bacterium]REJ95090.1 MAG: sugar phosphate isomerase/epimerase [Planctomycetota bacterium]